MCLYYNLDVITLQDHLTNAFVSGSCVSTLLLSEQKIIVSIVILDKLWNLLGWVLLSAIHLSCKHASKWILWTVELELDIYVVVFKCQLVSNNLLEIIEFIHSAKDSVDFLACSKKVLSVSLKGIEVATSGSVHYWSRG